MLIEHLANAQRHVAHLGEGHAVGGIQVDAQLVGVIDVGRAHGPRVEVDAAGVDHPREVRVLVADAEVSGAAARERDVRGLHPRRPVRRRALLEERLSVGAVDVALEHHRTVADAA